MHLVIVLASHYYYPWAFARFLECNMLEVRKSVKNGPKIVKIDQKSLILTRKNEQTRPFLYTSLGFVEIFAIDFYKSSLLLLDAES